MFESARGHAQGRAGGGYVIDQANVFAGKVGIGSNSESAAQIVQPFAHGQGGLLDGVADTQQIPSDGDIESLFVEVIARLSRDQIGLVVVSLPAAAPVQGDGDQHIHTA